jgi:hypothetical protein
MGKLTTFRLGHGFNGYFDITILGTVELTAQQPCGFQVIGFCELLASAVDRTHSKPPSDWGDSIELT